MDRITRQTLEVFRGEAARREESMASLLDRAGVSKAWLSKVVSTDGCFSCDVALRLLNAVGWDLVVTRR